jgi:hypothetical protein
LHLNYFYSQFFKQNRFDIANFLIWKKIYFQYRYRSQLRYRTYAIYLYVVKLQITIFIWFLTDGSAWPKKTVDAFCHLCLWIKLSTFCLKLLPAFCSLLKTVLGKDRVLFWYNATDIVKLNCFTVLRQESP